MQLDAKTWLAAAAVGFALGPTARAVPAAVADPIRYRLTFPQAAQHYVEVEATFPAGARPSLDLMMAVWTPGSYLIREFSRHVEGVTAATLDGKALAIEKTAKNHWRVSTGGARAVRVSYRVYCRELGVRTNYIERDFGFVNGAATFLTPADALGRPHEVTLELPAQWPQVVTPLDPAADAPVDPRGASVSSAGAPQTAETAWSASAQAPAGGGVTSAGTAATPAAVLEGAEASGRVLTFRAPDFDTLVDSPILMGNPALYQFEVDGKPHLIANEGEGGVWDGPRSAADVEKIVREYRRMWGFLPYPSYAFLNVLTEASGGLEHKNATLLLASRFKTRTRKGYLDWLGLVAHEYLHAWNVKRLRPMELGPFDYEHEAYTKSLWISEGLTEYYQDVAVRRAGLSTDKEYLRLLSQQIDKVQTAPGRLVQSLELSSFDAWIEEYRPDENSTNTAISYYPKGAVVGFLLDAAIRKASSGAKSLDDVFRRAYEHHSGGRGFTPVQFEQIANGVAGADLSPFFARAVRSTQELDYAPALDWYGLRFKAPDEKKDEDEDDPKEDKAWLGLVTRNDGGRLLVAEVRRGGPGDAAGISAEDEILAVGDFRVTPERWDARMEQYKQGERVPVLVSRRERLVRLEVELAREPKKLWRLEVRPDASEEQKARLQAWLQP